MYLLQIMGLFVSAAAQAVAKLSAKLQVGDKLKKKLGIKASNEI